MIHINVAAVLADARRRDALEHAQAVRARRRRAAAVRGEVRYVEWYARRLSVRCARHAEALSKVARLMERVYELAQPWARVQIDEQRAKTAEFIRARGVLQLGSMSWSKVAFQLDWVARTLGALRERLRRQHARQFRAR